MKTPIFECPSCGAEVEGVADYIARGVKCPACGIGFSPVAVETRRAVGVRGESGWIKWVVIGIAVVAAVALFWGIGKMVWRF